MLIRPYGSIYFRRRDMIATAGMASVVPVFIYLAHHNGWSERDGVALAFLAAFIAVTRAATLLIDASLRRRTKYELCSGTLRVFRDEELVNSIPPSDLHRLRPDSVDNNGRGSAELPHTALTDGRAFNRWTILIPALYADAELSVVPDVVQVCARIRAEAMASSPSKFHEFN